MVSTGSILLLTFWTFLLTKRGQLIALFFIDLFVTFITISDLVYYRYFHDLIAVQVLFQINQVGAISGSITDLFERRDILFILDFILLVPALIFIWLKTNKEKLSWSWMRAATTIIVFIIGLVFVMAPIQNYIQKYSVALFNQNWYNVSIYQQTGLLGFHAYDSYRYIDENLINKKQVSAADRKQIKEWFNEHNQKLQQPTEFKGIAEGKNVIVVQLEAYQNFFINKKINGKEITPNINKLIGETMYFDNFYRQTALGRTSDAEFLANAALHPTASGSVYVRYAGNEFDALPNILKEEGYETAAFHAYEKGFWNRNVMYNTIGFDHFFGKGDFEPGEIAGWTLGDRPFLQQTVDQMLTFEKPFYAFAVALTSHHPYTLQGEHKVLDVGKYEGSIMGDYIHSVHYVDKAVGEMVERLKKEGLWDESIFMMYGDHDAGINEKEQLTEIAGLEPTEFNKEAEFRKIPLIVHLPDGKGKGVYHKSSGQIDIAPSILHALGIDKSELYMMGDNLFTKENHLTVFRNGSFINGEVLYLVSGDGIFENGKCFDTESGELTSVNACKAGFEEAKKRLSTSDTVINGNLIEQFRKDSE
ncbi:LTA synthase family protein [Bacillus sp. Marseille-Q3570]|uniref:LTA synthase family protein n=1 Tax=Bacillus sp. Marseille-Q3570 TaxID=2963522 RepID=UPI0021B7692D|nr:LTA synthase family protein [Bacillus sp. Marseille-Q3570]